MSGKSRSHACERLSEKETSMPHERGAVPGRTSKDGERTSASALPGEHTEDGQASPPAPLGYGEGADETFGTGVAPDADPEMFYDPSEGESAMGTGGAPYRGNSIAIGDRTITPGA
jgi:hypothetical protein